MLCRNYIIKTPLTLEFFIIQYSIRDNCKKSVFFIFQTVLVKYKCTSLILRLSNNTDQGWTMMYLFFVYLFLKIFFIDIIIVFLCVLTLYYGTKLCRQTKFSLVCVCLKNLMVWADERWFFLLVIYLLLGIIFVCL